MFSAVLVGDDLVAADLLALGPKLAGRERAIVMFYGFLYETRVKAAASGRPGPRVLTGDYRRSINTQPVQLPSGPAAIVGTNAPQARRLEFGFVGVDSSRPPGASADPKYRHVFGRHYNQPPYPHWEPPLAKTAEEFEQALAAAVLEATT